MKVLMISGDQHILTEGTEAHFRLGLQKASVEQLDAFVWPQTHSWREIYLAAQKNRYDVVTAQDPFWRGLLALWIARRTKTLLNLQVHTDLSAQPLLRRFLARFLLRRANSVRVVSEKIRRQVLDTKTKAEIHLLPVYVDIRRFQNLVSQSHHQKTILWIGRFESEKDPLHAIRILKEVRMKGIDAKLVMLGTGSLESELKHLSEDLPVELPGWKDPVKYLQAADVVLCTSRHESWGASIVEALATGVAVVAPDVGVAQEAGAFIVDRAELSSKVFEVLLKGLHGALRLKLSSLEEWTKRWRETLA